MSATVSDTVENLDGTFTMSFTVYATFVDDNTYGGSPPDAALDIDGGVSRAIGTFSVTVTGGDVSESASTSFGDWIEVKTACSFNYSAISLPAGTSTDIPNP